MHYRPPGTRSEHVLPFGQLEPEPFERLCLGLIRLEGYEDIQHLGASGGEQGRDIIAVRMGRRFAFQCKKVRAFYPADAKREVDKILSLPAEDRPEVYVFLLASDASDKARKQAKERAGTIDCQFWARTELDLLVRKYPELVHQFFDLPALSTPADSDELRTIWRLLDDKMVELPPNAPPSKILTADYRVIPFDEVGRREELELLASFSYGEQRRNLLLLTGEGGTGKTRLLIEWCRRLRHEGWHAGFLRSDKTNSDLDPLLEGLAPRLVVVDYAETRIQLVDDLLSRAGRVPEGGSKIRIVLLARQARNLWNSLQQKTEGPIGTLLAAAPSPRQLRPLVPDAGDRPLAFQWAARTFAAKLGRKVPRNLVVPDLSGQDFERVLYLHMAALAALEGEKVESASDALTLTLNRERRYWNYHIGELGLDGRSRSQLENAIDPAIAVLTFLGGASDREQAERSIASVIVPLDLTSDLKAALLKIIQDLCGSPGEEKAKFLEPLKPDLLGEQLVIERWTQDILLWKGLLVTAKADRDNYAIQALRNLARLARFRPEAKAWLSTALKDRGERLFSAVLEVAIEAGDPIGPIFAQLLEEESFILPARIMILCGEERYSRSVPLREVEEVSTSQVLDILKGRWTQPTVEQRAELARLSLNRGQCLHGLGRNEEALEITREAVDTYRQFARRNPKEFLSHLATSLNNLGTILSELGLSEEALQSTSEALEVHWLLAQDYQAKFAACLDNQANRLGELGRYQEALQISREALAIRRKLVVAKDANHFHSDLATSLNNLCAHLKALGLNEEAVQAGREAVEIRRDLAESRPDIFLPDLATSLNNLGALLAGLGRQEESLGVIDEAVWIWRRLAENRPDAFLSGLAGGLENLGTVLSDLGQHEKALDAIREANQIYRPLAQRIPYLFEPKLAQALSSLSNLLSDLGRVEEALDLVRQSELLFRRLAQQRPEVFLAHLAGCLVNLGNRFGENGRLEDGLQASEEAVVLYRQLVQSRPEVFPPDLAKALMGLGNRLREVERIEEAVSFSREAVDIYRRLAAQSPSAFLPGLAMSLNNLGHQLGDGGKKEEALWCLKEAIEIYRELAAQRPDAFLLDLAKGLNNLGLQLGDERKKEEALLYLKEAMGILELFLSRRRDALLPWMKSLVQNYREYLQELGLTPDEEFLRPLRENFQGEG